MSKKKRTVKKETSQLLKVYSPKDDRQYTLLDVLKKGITRSGLYCSNISKEVLCSNKDSKDILLSFKNLECSNPVHGASVKFSFSGSICVHKARNGRIEFRNWIPDHNVLPDDYDESLYGTVSTITEEEDIIVSVTVGIKKFSETERKMIFSLLTRVITEEYLS